jgi:hypothetical protein
VILQLGLGGGDAVPSVITQNRPVVIT